MASKSIGDMRTAGDRRNVFGRSFNGEGEGPQSDKDYMDTAVKDTTRILQREGQRNVTNAANHRTVPREFRPGQSYPRKSPRKTARGGSR